MKKGKRKYRRLFLLLVATIITTVVFVVETYAWFVGISTVNVDEFSISITAADGLELSLSGNNWQKNTLTVNKSTVEDAYTDNTNI